LINTQPTRRHGNIKQKIRKTALGLLLATSMLLMIGCVSAGTIGGYFMPSGYYGGHSGYYEWIDYCPLCGHYGTLENNPKGTYEGEISCGRCDADYDGCTGYDKHGRGARAKLKAYVPKKVQNKTETPASAPKNEPKVVEINHPLGGMVTVPITTVQVLISKKPLFEV